jgi:hypothetical protein
MTGSYALVFWLPQLVRQLALGGSEHAIGTSSALPLLGLAVGLILNARRFHRRRERLLHTGIPCATAGLAMLAAAALPPGWPVVALLCLAGLSIGAAQGVVLGGPGDRAPRWRQGSCGRNCADRHVRHGRRCYRPVADRCACGVPRRVPTGHRLLASLLVVALPVIAPDRSGGAKARPPAGAES